ncbi:PI-PLC domain-containing protein [Mycoplasmopsis edwardii]|nr:hypothetical protein [Mycoplasmopsis edwardii]
MKHKKLIPLFALSVAAVPLAVVSSFRDNDHHRIIWQDSSLSYYNNNNYNINDYDFSTWMSEINDNKSFFDLSIPGSHDSGMWDGSGIAWAFGSRHARTQSLNIPNQLKAGIRAFDIRLDSEMWLRHGDTYSTLRFWDWMNQIVDFLKAHPREFVVARIKDEGFNVHDRGLAKHASELYEHQLNLHSSHIFNHWGRYKDDLDWRVKNLRGKLIIINNWHHKVNEMRRGGALYDDIITRTYSLQDQYQQRNTKTKARLVHEHMERSNSAPIRDKQLFVNFTSISSAGALGSDPSGFAGDMNWRVNDNVKNRPDLTKLGIVFMDFPGASLIQTIFKTNYYLKDEELALGYHKPLATNVSVDRISNSSNQVTINGNNLADLRIEIRYKGNTVQKVIVPGDVENSYTFNFTGGIFEVDDSYTFQFYKEYPASYFYSSKRYNQFEITQQAHDDAFYENVNALKSRIESLMETYNGKSNEVKDYLNNYFLNKIKSLTVSNATNKEKLNLLRGQFIQYQSVFNDIRTIITEFQTVNDELQRLADELNEFIKSDIRNEFNQFLNNLNQYLRTVLIDSVNIDQIRLNDIWDNIRSKKQIMSNIIIYLKSFKTVNVSQLLSELKSKATELGVDHDYINNVDEPTKLIILNASNQLMRSEETYTEPHLNSFKQKLEREKNKYQKTLTKIRTIKTKLNTLQLTPQEVSLFVSRINNIVREENSNPEALTNDLQEYQNLITEGIALINADEEFQSDNYFDNITDLKTSYLDKIGNLKTYISLRTTEPVDKLTYSDIIPEIKKIKEQIKEKTRVQKEFVNKINALEKIFPRQKEYFNNLVKSDDNVGTQIFDNAEALNERDYVGKFALLTDLNEAQHNRYIDEIGEIVDYEEIETIYNKYIILNRKMTELKELINDLSDYDSLDSFGSLTQEEQRAFISIYDAARETFEGDSEMPAVINAIENLEKYFYLKYAELNNKINTLRQQINSDKKLYIF